MNDSVEHLTVSLNWLWGYGEKPRRLIGAVGITVIGMLIASWTKKIMYR